jgi:hypothetical protein
VLARLVDFEPLGENIRAQRLALGVLATPPQQPVEPAAGWYFDGGPRLNTPVVFMIHAR